MKADLELVIPWVTLTMGATGTLGTMETIETMGTIANRKTFLRTESREISIETMGIGTMRTMEKLLWETWWK